MSALRRIFSAPGNPRVWISLVLYVSALVAILVYRERIGQKAAQKFQELTAPAAPPVLAKGETVETPSQRVGRILQRAPGEREKSLLALARKDDDQDAALGALRRLTEEEEPGVLVLSPALLSSARACIDDGKRALRAVCASLLLASEKVPRATKVARALTAALRDATKRRPRLEALRRLGLLGLTGVRSRTAERQALTLLAAKEREARIEAARALGRVGDASFQAPLTRLVSDTTPRDVREGALAGLVDLGLAGPKRRSRVLRALAAALADKNVTGEHAEQTWQALRRLAANGKLESKMPQAQDAVTPPPVNGTPIDRALPAKPGAPAKVPVVAPSPTRAAPSPLAPLIK